VRPDGFVAWRRAGVAPDAQGELAGAMARVLGLRVAPAAAPALAPA